MKLIKKNKFCKDGECNCNIKSNIDKMFPYYKPNCLTKKDHSILKDCLIGLKEITNKEKNTIEKQFNKIFKQKSHKTYSDTMYNHLDKIFNLY